MFETGRISHPELACDNGPSRANLGRQARYVLPRACRRRCRMRRDAAGEKVSLGPCGRDRQALCRCRRIDASASPGSRCAQPAPGASHWCCDLQQQPRQSRHLGEAPPLCGCHFATLGKAIGSPLAFNTCEALAILGSTIDMTGGSIRAVSAVKKRGVLHRFRGKRASSLRGCRSDFRCCLPNGGSRSLAGSANGDVAG